MIGEILMWVLAVLIMANMVIWGFVIFIIALPLLVRAVMFMYGFTVGVIEGFKGK